MTRLVLEGFAGPGGWSQGMAMLGHHDAVGVEIDRDACRTAMAASHVRVQADVAAFPLAHLAGRVDGAVMSPPCPLFSNAGQRLGLAVMDTLLAAIAPMLAGEDVRGQVRGDVYPAALAAQQARNETRPPAKQWPQARVEAAARADAAQAALVLEPARWAEGIAGLQWLACEQVPAALPLWAEYARCLRRAGWSATAGLLSAEQFGVPQTRLRAFLVARCDGQPARLPAPSHARYVPARRADEPAAEGLFVEPARERAIHPADRGLLPWVSMADALGINADRPGRTVAGHRAPRWAYGTGKTSYSTGWTLQTNQVPGGTDNYQRRDVAAPAPAVSGQGRSWSWQLEAGLGPAGWDQFPSGRAKANDRTRPRTPDQPAMTVAFGHSDMRWQHRNDWPAERSATAVCGDPRLAGPGGRDWKSGQRQYDEHIIRVGVPQAGVLQGFTPDYPWQGNRTSRFGQVGNCVPAPLAAAVAGEMLDIDWKTRLWEAAS